jgi:hypothetical protein
MKGQLIQQRSTILRGNQYLLTNMKLIWHKNHFQQLPGIRHHIMLMDNLFNIGSQIVFGHVVKMRLDPKAVFMMP